MQVCLSIYDVLKPTVLKKLRKHAFSYGEQFSEAGISGKFKIFSNSFIVFILRKLSQIFQNARQICKTCCFWALAFSFYSGRAFLLGLGLFLNFDDIYTRQICFKLKRSLKIFSKMELCHIIFGQNVNKIAFTCACIQKTNEEVFIMWLKSINNYFFCYCFLLFHKVDVNKRKNKLFFFFFDTLKN